MIKILELFGGIGSPRKALINLGYKVNTIDYVEIDKDAVKSYNAIFSETFKPQDILNWNKDVQVDMIFHGSPCQDFSIAGTNMGGDYGSGTRSSLLYETLRIVEKIKPKYVIWENVKNVISKKHKHNFDAYLTKMEQLGYTNNYQILNARDYGIPQNRERIFVVSILGNHSFKFPNKQELENNLIYFLKGEVDDYYYKVCPSMLKALNDGKVKDITNSKYCSTITTKQQRWNNCGMFRDNKGLRYLTPIETWLLMGFTEDDYNKASLVCKRTALYKQAGNSIVVQVLEAIFKELLKLNGSNFI